MRIILILIILFFSSCQAREEIPILPLDRGVYIKYSDNSLDLIDVDKMKKAKSVQRAKEELKEKSINTIQIDTRYLRHQRALDYVTNPNNYLMPPIL